MEIEKFFLSASNFFRPELFVFLCILKNNPKIIKREKEKKNFQT